MASTIQIRVDDDLKNKSDQLFKDLGTDTTSDMSTHFQGMLRIKRL